MMAARMVQAGWTAGEIERAEMAISSDADLLEIVGYERTVGPRVFAEARRTPAVKAGRLWDHAEALAYAQSLGGAWAKYLADHFRAVRVGEDARFIFNPDAK